MERTPTHNRIERTAIATDTGHREAQSHDDDAPVHDVLVYRWVGIMLRAGMTVSFVAMGSGLVWWLMAQAGNGEASIAPAPLQAPGPGVRNPLTLLDLGLIALLATPVMALAAGTIAYVLEGNRRYAIIGVLVGTILLAGLALSMRWLPGLR